MMQTQCLVVFLVVGALAITSKGVRHFQFFSELSELERVMKTVKTGTEETFQKLQKDVEDKKESCNNALSTKLQPSSTEFKEQLQKELKEALDKGDGMDTKKIEECVKSEQKSYQHKFLDEYIDALECIKNVTGKANEEFKTTKEQFNEKFKKNEDAAKKLSQECQWRCIRGDGRQCVADCYIQYYDLTEKAKKASKESIEMGQETAEDRIKEMDLCVEFFKKGITEVNENHKNLLGKCSVNSTNTNT